jgi:outer membrane lipoprotein-sorting protein
MKNLPPSLVRFGSQLEDAIRAHPGVHGDDLDESAQQRSSVRGARRRRWATLVVGAAAAAVVAVVALMSLPSSQQPASAVERAASVLAAADDTILHIIAVETHTSADGRSNTDRTESWQRLAPPYDRREIIPDGRGGVRAEVGWSNGVLQQYDPASNTITQTPHPDPPTGPDLATGRLEFFRDRMLDLLRSGDAKASPATRLGGRDVIRITAFSSAMSMIVDAHTYEPVEWTIKDAGETTSFRFEVYERLPVDNTTLRMVSITASHPDATITD